MNLRDLTQTLRISKFLVKNILARLIFGYETWKNSANAAGLLLSRDSRNRWYNNAHISLQYGRY